MTAHRTARAGLVLTTALTAALATTLVAGTPAGAQPRPTSPPGRQGPTGPQAVAVGTGGAVASVDPDATAAGVAVLRSGGNAVDAAVTVAATLGVTEPYVAGVGGGGFFVFYDARTGQVHTLDGRETAPARMRSDSFLDPATGAPLPFATAVASGLSVGVPGNLLTWQEALSRWGTTSLPQALKPAEQVARRGFVVDQTFHDQTAQNAAKFGMFTSSAMWLPGGAPPAVGSVFRNPDLAATYRQIERQGPAALYRGDIGRDLVRTVQNPPLVAGTPAVPRGLMDVSDLAAYTAPLRAPTHVSYRGLDVYSMAPPSSGGSTVGEALNILSRFDLAHMSRTQVLHHYLEASRLSFADRNRWVGDADQVDVPLDELLSNGFAGERACQIDPTSTLTSPVAPGAPDGQYSSECPTAAVSDAREPVEGTSTNHFVVSDRWGNVVSYTNTIEQLAGSGITVPGRGFLLNNELTDFNFTPIAAGVPDPNLPAAGKRPRSSMSPTIVLRDGRPWLAVGSPGGATIITTVLQTLVNRIDLDMSLPEAIAAPRASQRNAAQTEAEPGFLAQSERGGLEALGQSFRTNPEIGAAAGLEFLGDGVVQAAAEPVRRGGGAAGVVHPVRQR